MRARLAASGFDLVHAFDAAVAAREPGLAMLGSGLGLLVGNTRELWPHFLHAVHSDAALAADPDPLDRYTERAISPLGGRAYFAHRQYADGYLPFQRLAVAAGLAALAPVHLAIHPIYGPWFALRAVIILEGVPPKTEPIPLPCCCDASCRSRLAVTSDDWRTWLAVRDSCSVGQHWRYSDEQITYHYTKDRTILGRAR